MIRKQGAGGCTTEQIAGRIYAECPGCHDGANGPNNRHGAAVIEAFTADHKCGRAAKETA